MIVLQKKLIRIVTCSPYRAHSKPLLVANNVLSVNEINVYIVGIFMYNYCQDHLPNLFDGFFQRINEVHDRNTRQSNELHVKFARTDVRKFSLRIHGARIWNDISMYIKHATSVNVFKQMLKKHLINTNLHAGNCHTILRDLFIDWLLDDRCIVWCHLDTVSSLQNPHKRYPIAHPWWGWDMGCLLWAQDLFHVLPQLLQYCYIGPHYNDIRLYAFQRIMWNYFCKPITTLSDWHTLLHSWFPCPLGECGLVLLHATRQHSPGWCEGQWVHCTPTNQGCFTSDS